MDSCSADAGTNDDEPTPPKKQRLTVIIQNPESDRVDLSVEKNSGDINGHDTLIQVYSLARSDTEEYILHQEELTATKGVEHNHSRNEVNNDKRQTIETTIVIPDNTLVDETVNESVSNSRNENFGLYDRNESNSERESPFQNPSYMTIHKDGLNRISSLVRDAKIISSVVPDVNYNTIYNKLLEVRSNENRLDVVTSDLLEGSKCKGDPISKVSDSNDQPSAANIFDEVEFIMKQFPTANANLVFAYLESMKVDEPNRIQKAVKEIGLKNLKSILAPVPSSELKHTILKRDSSDLNDPALASDPIFKDMRTVAKMFPEHDRNEIYALLEANIGKNDRLQIVINELLQAEPKKIGAEKQNSSLNSGSLPNDTTNISSNDLKEFLIEEDVEHLRLLFPDCDPNYLYEKLDEMKDVFNRQMILAGELTDKRDYPKLKERLEKEKLREEKTKQCKYTFTEEEFLNKFSDPQKTFGDGNKPVSDLYKAHAKASIINDFLMIKKDYLIRILEEHNYHFYLAFKKINNDIVHIPIAERKNHRRFNRRRRSKMEQKPTENDEYFFHEYWFTHNELKLEDYVKQKELERQIKVQDAKERGELYECCCCFDDECLFEDLANCPEGHLFCKVCVVRSTEAAFGEMKTRFPCLTGDCDQELPLSILQGIIPANLFSKIVSRLQEEEVLQAGIADLVTCPFCPFATVMPNPNDKILKCLNPNCLKESCRLCREDSHIPLKCNEVESRAGTKMRTYIENKVAEAVMRKCDKCGKKFLKDSGCNKMTCVCGATSCYFCKKQNIDYDHFNGNTKCGQADPNVIHERDMKEAAHKAMEEYILEHPEAADLDLKSDLKDIVQNYVSNFDNLSEDDYESDPSESGSDSEDYY